MIAGHGARPACAPPCAGRKRRPEVAVLVKSPEGSACSASVGSASQVSFDRFASA